MEDTTTTEKFDDAKRLVRELQKAKKKLSDEELEELDEMEQFKGEVM